MKHEGREKRFFETVHRRQESLSVRRLFIRALLFLLLIVAVYGFWPRFPSLAKFRPAALAALECEVFENSLARKSAVRTWTLYRIFQEELHLPPIASAKAAWNSSKAIEVFFDSADNADRERAMPYLERTFEVLREQTDSRFDPAVIARLQLQRWMLASDGNRQNQLPAAIGEILAMLYGGSASEYSAAAVAFAKADRLLASHKPEAARQVSASAWRRLLEQLQARTQDKS